MRRFFVLLVITIVLSLSSPVYSAGDGAVMEKIVDTVKLKEMGLRSHGAVYDAANFTKPFNYPLLKQCVDPWGDDIMVTKTICQVGCLMSSTSMGLAGTDIQIPAGGGLVDANPGTLNKWLQNNGGYDEDNDFIEPVAVNINPDRIVWPDDAMHKTNDLGYDTVKEYLDAGRIVIGNVMEGHHFVLLTGYSTDGDTFAVNDPGFNTLTYSYKEDIVGYRIFDMKRE
jgi:hypothetical protein